MTLPNATGEDIAAACARLSARADLPAATAAGLGVNDPDAMRAAVQHLIDARRLEGLRDIVEPFRDRQDFGVWARVTSAQLHRANGDFADGLADIDDLLARFPARTGAHWFIARARCLEGLGRDDEAVEAVREAVLRFPAAAPPRAFLANLLSRLKRGPEALEVWREAHARFSEPELSWFVGLANALKAVGRHAEGAQVLEQAIRRFEQDPRTPLAALAELAEIDGQWARALEIWRALGTRSPDERAEIGVARALFRLGEVDDAIGRLDGLPGSFETLRERAAMAGELGDATHARDLLIELTQRYPERTRPERLAALARAHCECGDAQESVAVLDALERRFPDSPLGLRERLRQARREERGLDELAPMIAQGRQRFPEDFDLAAQGVWIALSLGQPDEATRGVEALEQAGTPGYALEARLKLEADRGGGALRDYAQAQAAHRDWSAADAGAFGQAMLDARALWAFKLGEAVLDEPARTVGDMRATVARIRLKIALRRDEEALALIDAISPRYVRLDVLELRAWSEATRGRHDSAKRIWAQAVASHYFPALHSPIDALTRVSPDDRPPPEAGPSAYMVFRDEAAQIPGFLAHHRKIGVRRFVFFDHSSTDASRSLLLREPDVVVYDCPDSFKLSSFGRRWINEVIAREGARGWGLQLDLDERLIYPGYETAPLDRFIAYLEAEGAEAVPGYLLDVFAPRLGDAASEHRWYDDDYHPCGLVRAPYRSVGGGARVRLFEASEYLHKIPLWRLDAGHILNAHENTHMKMSGVSCALLHLKMLNIAIQNRLIDPEQSRPAYLEADTDVEVVRRYTRYVARLETMRARDLRAGVSRELEDSLALAARGLMDVSQGWRARLRESGY